MSGLLDWVDPTREWFKSRPDIVRGLLSGAYELASDPAAREAAMARQPKPFTEESAKASQAMAEGFWNPAGLLGGAMGVTKFEKAHKVAQKNAAKPVEKGGLGLPKDNTAADRAKAMGFDKRGFHGTIADPDHLIPMDSGAVFATVGDTKTAREIASKYAGGDWTTPIARDSLAISGKQETPQVLPLLLRGVTDEYVEAQIKDPRNIRSRFAAFDPARKHEADLLAGYFGFQLPQFEER